MWIELLYLLISTHLTIISVTLYLHRSQTHRAVEFHPVLNHLMRFWLWLTTGMITKQWVAVHRLHHRFCETKNDPHSPKVHGILNVLFKGALLYNAASKDHNMVNSYGVGTPADWLEQKLYSSYPEFGIGVLLLLNIGLFGWVGLAIWAIQMIWIPFWAAGVVNGIGHYWGYRVGHTRDNSRNIFPWGMLIGGEELHNGHHLNPASPKFSRRWWEIDLGWVYIKFLCWLKLAKLT